VTRILLSGNEAIAQGAWEAGARAGVGYPGTPSTETLERFATLPGVYAEWAPNEKVALEVAAGVSLAGMRSPRIEPEIVFKLNKAIPGETPGAALEAVEWLALGFEIVDCVFPDWKFQPADFVASFGLHAALIVGKPVRIEPDTLPTLAEQLPTFKLVC